MKNLTTKNARLAAATAGDPRWAAVAARDPQADGTFFHSVSTAGVYCRPSCGSRSARPENVAFHAAAAVAQRAGFLPCRRCKPDEPALAARHSAKVAELCRVIEAAARAPTLDELAKLAGSSVSQRIGAAASVRAVGRACGANTLAVAIPRHRVVRNDGALAGYRWGVERKHALLQRERAQGPGTPRAVESPAS